MADSEQHQAIIPAIYDAALDRALWPGVIGRVGDLIGTHCNTLLRQHAATGAGQAIGGGFDPAATKDYFGYYGRRNVLLQRMQNPLPGTIRGDRDIVSKAEFRRTEYYNDLLRARLDVNAVLLGLLWRDERDVVAVTFCRSPRGGEIEAEDKRRLAALVPHFQRAFALSLRLGTLEAEARRGVELLDRTAHATLVLDEKGRVLFANLAAERLLAETDGIFAGRDGLAAATPDQTVRLGAAIARAAQGDDGGAVKLDRPRRGRPLYALATPLGLESVWMQPGGRRVLLLLRDPEPRPVLSERHLFALFGLTPAEARVALRLHQGENPAAIAAALGISRNTARARLNAVLRKTGAHRQAELIRRLTVLADLADRHDPA